MIQPNSENIIQTSTTIYLLPTGKAILETDTSSPSPHLTSIYEIVKETPLVHAINLSLKLNNRVLLKREDLQDVFNFKIRGVAISAKKLGLPATMVRTTPSIKYKSVERLGSNVVLYRSDFDKANKSTIGMEILRQHYFNEIDAIFACVGGGGLIAIVLKEVGLFADGAAVKVVDTRSIVESADALGLAGANMNFEHLRFVAEWAGFGEQHEALISVIIPEHPGSFIALYNHINTHPITEFSYSYSDSEKAWIYMPFRVDNRGTELQTILENLKEDGIHGLDISDNEIAKTHARYLIEGRSIVENERLFRFELPGALKKLLTGLKSN
ncbi:14554_t:CDS:10 [Entrophospora sp. SA101]|nr:16835_t:CDS:10 [Entrophospora sp. SA101]CAJ0914056.1 14554_t:CDS:10 [Entrophospora sp. SA101]